MVKVLEASMIYPIFDSHWINHIQVVPKKEGMTVICNENNELIPFRMLLGGKCV